MMFLIRTAFWLSLVILLIPVDEEIAAQASEGEPVGAVDALFAARETISDVGGFCARSPTACRVGGEFLDLLALKAQSGVKLALEFFAEPRSTPVPTPLPIPAPGTLQASDLQPAWRGPGEAI